MPLLFLVCFFCVMYSQPRWLNWQRQKKKGFLIYSYTTFKVIETYNLCTEFIQLFIITKIYYTIDMNIKYIRVFQNTDDTRSKLLLCISVTKT